MKKEFNDWWNDKNDKEKYFEKRKDNLKSNIWDLKDLKRNGDISKEEAEKEIAKLEKRLERNEKKYTEYLNKYQPHLFR